VLTAKRRTALAVLAVCATLLTSACAAGRHAPTAEESPAIDGVGASVGSMLLREVSVASPPNGVSYAKGGAAVLRVVVVNNGTSDDQLTSITTPAASGVSLFDSLAAAGSLVSASASASFGASSSAVGTSPGTTPSASPTGSSSAQPVCSTGSSTAASSSPKAPASATTSGGGSGSAGSFTPVSVGALCRAAFGINGTDRALVLTGLTEQLFPATLVPVTFTFAGAGSITVQVPVQLTSSPNPTGVVVSDTVSSSPGI
jgi:copper(I)-binding protein